MSLVYEFLWIIYLTLSLTLPILNTSPSFRWYRWLGNDFTTSQNGLLIFGNSFIWNVNFLSPNLSFYLNSLMSIITGGITFANSGSLGKSAWYSSPSFTILTFFSMILMIWVLSYVSVRLKLKRLLWVYFQHLTIMLLMIINRFTVLFTTRERSVFYLFFSPLLPDWASAATISWSSSPSFILKPHTY